MKVITFMIVLCLLFFMVSFTASSAGSDTRSYSDASLALKFKMAPKHRIR